MELDKLFEWITLGIDTEENVKKWLRKEIRENCEMDLCEYCCPYHNCPKTLIDKWIPTSKDFNEAIIIVTHETLHEVVNNKLGIDNTTLTEALFDALAHREVCGLWFGQEIFGVINKFLKGNN